LVGIIGLAAGLPAAWRWLTTTEDGQRAGTALMALWLVSIGAWAGWHARAVGGVEVVRAAELDQASTIADLRGRLLAAEATASAAISGAMPLPGGGGPRGSAERQPDPSPQSPLGGAPVAMDVPASAPPAWMPETVTRWWHLFEASGARHGVDPVLLAIVCLAESGGGATARSGAGATGLMQVMPATARGIAAERGISDFSVDQLYDPQVSVDFGAYYLAQQLRAFGRADDADWLESVRNAAAAYNAGPGGAQRWIRSGTLPAETRSYIGWIGGMWAERHDAASPTFDRWMQSGGSRLVRAAQSH